MATKRPAPGLLSKVASFFRDASQEEEDAGDSQQAQLDDAKAQAKEFKDLMERKRRDDYVRKREFNQLRKLRKMRLGGALPMDMPVRPSVFQSSSGFGLEDRESTLQKINVIEAHMVQSWADAKVGRKTQSTPIQVSAPAKSAPATAAPAQPAAPAVELELGEDLDLDFTGLLTQPQPVPTQSQPLASAKPAPAQVAAPSGVELGLQEAALRFAEGDNRGAEVLLLGLFQDDDVEDLDADVLASALFDVYRASGQHDGFEALAMDYAQRFGRSPAEWFSVPELLGKRDAGADDAASQQLAGWVCPANLDAAAVVEVRERFDAKDHAWRIDWGLVREVDALALVPLSELFTFWCSNALELHWIGVDALLQALQLHTPPEDRSADPRWWLLRLQVLCVLGRSEEFEDVALDYCVVYEVSPPSWSDPRCTLADDLGAPAPTDIQAATTAMPVDASVPRSTLDRRCDLVGELVGDAPDALGRLRLASEGASDVLVSCALLLRVDRDAVSHLVSWAAHCASRGCHVRFTRVPCLVAILFQQVGMDQHAEVLVRVN